MEVRFLVFIRSFLLTSIIQVTDGGEGINLLKESRMLYVLGKETLVALKSTNVLIVGLRGLGVEVGT